MTYDRVNPPVASPDRCGNLSRDLGQRQAVDILLREHLNSRLRGEPRFVRGRLRKIPGTRAADDHIAKVCAESKDRTPGCRVAVGTKPITYDVQYRWRLARWVRDSHRKRWEVRSTADRSTSSRIVVS